MRNIEQNRPEKTLLGPQEITVGKYTFIFNDGSDNPTSCEQYGRTIGDDYKQCRKAAIEIYRHGRFQNKTESEETDAALMPRQGELF